MDNMQSNRIKSSMIVFQLEKDLGTYITNHVDSVEDISGNILKKVSNNVQSGQNLSVSNIISTAYLDDIFSIALDVSKGCADYEKLKKLKNLCQSLDLYSIRNAIAHPNKTFSVNYWYKTLAIATDPLIEMLGLSNVVTAYNNAMQGIIVSPPEEWLNKPLWFLPNNLPDIFEHNITGFVGRRKEKTEIRKLLDNKRHSFIAVTGPGGLGKTAIVLEILKELSLDPKVNSILDGILFISMKTEELTPQGIKTIDAVDTIERLKEKITESMQEIFKDEEVSCLDDAINKYKDKNILFFIDNLETLLRDNPLDFSEFVNLLPPTFRVIVSSRIPVDAAASYPLGKMDTADAELLARSYARRKSVASINESDIPKIASKLSNNPLAIRLFVDSVNASGKKMDEILSDVSGDIAEFSYKNLIEALQPRTIEVLELLFLQKSLTREEIVELTESGVDEIAFAISQLRKTSLLVSSQLDGCEKYDINEGVRSFLTFSQKNMHIREQLLRKIQKNKTILNEIENRRLNLNKNNNWFIPTDLPSELQKIIFNCGKVLKKRNRIQEVKKQYAALTMNEKRYEKYDIYWRTKACFLSIFKDIQTALECYSKAIELNDASFINIYELAKFYFYSLQDYKTSEYFFKKIIDKIENYDLDTYLVREVYSYYFSSMLYQGKNEEILEKTKKWNDTPTVRGVMGAIRAKAYKRISEKQPPVDKFQTLYRAIKIITDAVDNDDELKITKSTIKELVEELNFIADNCKQLAELSEKQKLLFDGFLERFDTNIAFGNANIPKRLSTAVARQTKQDEIDLKISQGYVYTEIYKIPEVKWGHSQYLFSKDNANNEYFIHIDNCAEIDWDDWKKLKIGYIALVKPQQQFEPKGMALPVDDVCFI